MQELTSSWKIDFQAGKDGTEEGEEEENFDDDDVVEPSSSKATKDEKRHHGKARKWQRMLKAGQIPDDIVQMYNNTALQQKQPRLFRTQLINKLFQVDSNGEYTLCSDSPSFQAWKTNVDKTWASQKTVGMPPMVMLWQVFHGNELAMQAAEAAGQIFERNGMYHAATSAGRCKTTADLMDLQGGSVDLDASSFAAMSNFLGKRDWAKYGQELEDPASEPPALKRGKSTLCLTDAPQASLALAIPSSQAKQVPLAEPKVLKLTWKMVEKTIGDAKGANERLQRDCSRLVVKVRTAEDDKLINKAKALVALLAENISALNECQMWEQVPGTDGNEKSKVESFLSNLAKKTEEVNEGLEELKAVCKARGL